MRSLRPGDHRVEDICLEERIVGNGEEERAYFHCQSIEQLHAQSSLIGDGHLITRAESADALSVVTSRR